MTIATDLTEEQVQQVFFCADQGYTKADAAKEMGICPAWMVRSAKRMGKKDDLIKEIEKMRDYCQRWIDVEKGR